MKTISIQCVHCHKRYNAPATMAGKKVKCKHCAKVFAIPVEAAAQDEAEAGLSAMGVDAQDTNTPAAGSSKAGVAGHGSRTGAGAGKEANGKLGSASAGFASRMERKEGVAEIEFNEGRSLYSLRPSVPFDFPGSAVLESLVPPVMILIGLGWLAYVAWTLQDTGVSWVGPMRAGAYLALSLGLAFPLGYWAIKHASRRERFMLPPQPGVRALACTSLAFAFALVLWLSGASVGMLITGSVIGLVALLGGAWFLFRLQPREMGTAFGGLSAAFVGAVAISYLLLLGVNMVFAAALTKSGTNEFAKAPMGPGFAWDVPRASDVAREKEKEKARRAAMAAKIEPPPPDPGEQVTIGTTQPNATQPAATPSGTDPGTPAPKPPGTDAVASAVGSDGRPVETMPPKPPVDGAGTPSNGVPNPNPGSPTASVVEDKKQPPVVESPLIAKVSPVDPLIAGSQLFFPSSGAATFGAVKRTPSGDEMVDLYTGNPPARSKVQVEPFVVEKKVTQNYVLSSSGELMARLTSFPLLAVQIVSTTSGKEVKQLPLDPQNGTPYLVGFGANDSVVVLWNTGQVKNGIEVLNSKATSPQAQRVTVFKIDRFDVVPGINPVISPDGRQLAAASVVNGAGGIDLYDLGRGLIERTPRTMKVNLLKWTSPQGMAYGPGGTLSAYFEVDGDGVLYHFQPPNVNPVHSHTFRGARALAASAAAAVPAGDPSSAAKFKGPTLEFVSPTEWLAFGRHLIDVESGRALGELVVASKDARVQAQRVVDKDTLLLMTCDPTGKDWLMQVDLKKEEMDAKRAELRKR